MEKLKIIILMLLLSAASYGQTAKQVLDKTAAIFSNKNGASAAFHIKDDKGNNLASGRFMVKGKKYCLRSDKMLVWYDGKTQWSAINHGAKGIDEVNVSTPKSSDFNNPADFIYLYRQGYSYTMKKEGSRYVVHLKATAKNKPIQEAYISVYQGSVAGVAYTPSYIKFLRNNKWTTISISGCSVPQKPIADATFRFNSKDFPQAEVIDLR